MAFNAGRDKDNANPTIFSVNTKRAHARKTPFGWSQLGTFTTNGTPKTGQDHAIIKALMDSSKATNGKNITILENAGLCFPHTEIEALTSPHFHFSQEESITENTKQEPIRDQISAEEVFDIIRNIQDPEHPNTLEELGVVSVKQVEVTDEDAPGIIGAPVQKSIVSVRFTPTIPHCSMATLIGLCIRVKLRRSLPSRFKVDVKIEPGTHASEKSINKQLRDKERVCAALENKALVGVVNKCLKP